MVKWMAVTRAVMMVELWEVNLVQSMEFVKEKEMGFAKVTTWAVMMAKMLEHEKMLAEEMESKKDLLKVAEWEEMKDYLWAGKWEH